MSLVSGVNGSLPASATLSIKNFVYNLIATMVSAGWIRKGNGDNSSFKNEGQNAGPYDTLITSAASWTDNGWIRIREPVGTREFVFRISSSGANFELYYSRSAGFTSGGSASAAPTATDQATCYNGSITQNANLRPHAVCENAAYNGAYYFWAACFVSGSATPTFVIMFDPLDSAQVHPSSNDPVVIYAASDVAASSMISLGQTGAPFAFGHAWRRYGQTDQAFMGIHCFQHAINNGSNAFPGGVPTNPYSGKDDIARLLWGRDAVDGGAFYAGASKYSCWKGVSARAFPDTLDLASSDARVYIRDIVLRWPTGVTPTL